MNFAKNHMLIFKKKQGFEMSFAWIFSIVVGAMILVLTLYVASKFINVGEYKINTETAKEIINLFDPIQTSIEQGKVDKLELIKDTRINTICRNIGDFGENRISLTEKSSFNKQWPEFGGDIKVNNQYIFSDEIIEGKKFYFIVKPFEMPFKIADIIVMYSESYCFIAPPNIIKEDLDKFISLNNDTNLEIKPSMNKCVNRIKVCFSDNSQCDIVVHCNNNKCEEGYVKKINVEGKAENFYFINNLLYGAIFSSYEDYNCNVERITKKISYLSQIYQKKAQFVSVRGCNTGLQTDLAELSDIASNIKKSEQIILIKSKADEIATRNQEIECQLY